MAWSISPQREDCNIDTNPTISSTEPLECKDICLNAARAGSHSDLSKKLDLIFEEKIDKICPGRNNDKSTTQNKSSNSSSKRFTKSLQHWIQGMVQINRQDLFNKFDFGMPMDPKADKEDVLLLYDSKKAFPSSDEQVAHNAEYNEGDIPIIDATTATENCDVMNVMFLKNAGKNQGMRQCVALVGGQYQSYHIQKWMRVVGTGAHGKIDKSVPLRVTGRMTKSDGYDELLYPKPNNSDMHREIMLTYLSNLPDIKKELGAILKRIAIDNTVIVSTVNKGQSELLMNFVCSSKSRGFDLKNLILFPTDEYSRDLAKGLGIETYYAEALMKDIPKQEAARYGDSTFGRIMMAKVICVHLVSELGYDMLFQDVDITWYKNPLEYFHNKDSAIANFDVYFQDDGNRQERYAPYSANSGFYYIRNNERSKVLFRTMLYSGDLIFACRSHQQILITLLAEANSLTGLRVKVLSRDGDEFPGGFHYHMRKNDYMKKFVHEREKIDPYIFHMSWTLNKDDKLKFLRQMGMWYISNDECIGKDVADYKDGDVVGACCSSEPNFSCHYKDKASIKPCIDSPPKDKNGKSFW